MPSTEFINSLRVADSEKLVESIYHNELRKGINSIGGQVESLKTICGTDGVLDGEFYFEGVPRVFRIIIETKMDESFSNVIVRSKVLAQVLYYLKKFEDIAQEPPNVVLVGDKNECFVVHFNYLAKYLGRNYDWSHAPSSAGAKNPELVKELSEDDALKAACFVYVIDDNFEFSEVVDKIYHLVLEIKTQVRITEKSISKVFDYFSMRVLKRNSAGESRYTAREQVEFFMQLVSNEKDCFTHPRKKGKAVFNGVEVDVDKDAFESFINHYKFDYNAEEKKHFTSICDRLIEDGDRRRKGDFYTPAIWVDEAHKMLAENLGYTWKDDYMVWDCAWGTGNLTRDYKFWDLYCSTLHEHDLKTGSKYNEEAKAKFQYDFLNDDVELFDTLLTQVKMGHKLVESDFYGSKLWQSAPNLIRGMLSGKKLLFFINPPYGAATNMTKGTGKEAKGGVSSTSVATLMLRDGLGSASQQLYTQFLYWIHQFGRLFSSVCAVGLFSPTLWLTGSRDSGLRDLLRFRYTFGSGIVFQASHFADVSGSWGISFVVLSEGSHDFITFELDQKDFRDSGVVTTRRKTLYNVEDHSRLSTWAREEVKGLKVYDAPQMKSALSWDKNPKQGKLVSDALGYLVLGGNNVNENNSGVFLLSSCRSVAHGYSIIESNFDKSMSIYAARRLISGQYSDWSNSKDEYLIPDLGHPLYRQWESDCLVLSLFSTASNQSSLRQIDYNGKTWNILNHFFFMSREEMRQLALGESPNDEVYHDLEQHGADDRFVYKKLQEVQLSPDANAVLEIARLLVRESFKYRDIFNQEYPEYHINTWDAGWYQIKGLLKAYMPDELKEFNQLYKQFEDRMRPLVVELGFLYDYPGYEEERKKYLGDTVYEIPEGQPEIETLEVSEPKPINFAMLGNTLKL